MTVDKKGKCWFTLKEACELKGVNYRTALNKKELCPNSGIPDGIVMGRKMWKMKTIERWLNMTDDELLSYNKGDNHE